MRLVYIYINRIFLWQIQYFAYASIPQNMTAR